MKNQFNYGGQAVIEGVMMRGSRHMAVAVRDPDGNIVTREDEITSPLYNGWLAKVPFVRGLGLLWDSLGLGMRSLLWSADVAVGEEAEFGGPIAVGTVALSFLLAIGLFFLIPAAAGDGLHRLIDPADQIFGVPIGEVINPPESDTPPSELLFVSRPVVGNLLEGVVRLIMVVGYIGLIAFMPDVQRLYGYHGAEHKVINAYEAGAPLTPESAAEFPLSHPRCGTGFLLVVVGISVIVFTLLGDLNIWMRLLSRVLLIPVIAGIAYEYIRFMARNLGSPIVQLLIKPQLWLQKLTTREPELEMLEVSIHAFQTMLAAEQDETSIPEALPAEAK